MKVIYMYKVCIVSNTKLLAIDSLTNFKYSELHGKSCKITSTRIPYGSH